MIYKYIEDYLKDRNFNNGLKVKFQKEKLLFRDEYLIELSRNKKIIHIGFLDHIQLIEKK